jgi:outer membrane lipoprotein-sorting protein
MRMHGMGDVRWQVAGCGGAALALVIVALGSAIASAQETKLTGQQVLEKMDALRNKYQDQEMGVKWTIVDAGGKAKEYTFNLKQKGDDKRMVRFNSGEVNGTAVLTCGAQMDVYLPGYKKVRRVAAHNMNQAFLGSDFTNMDMAIVSWSSFYQAQLDREDEKSWFLTLTAKAGVAPPYAKVKMEVARDGFAQMLTEYFNDKGEKIKEFKVLEVKTFPNGEKLGSRMVMSDPRTGHKTELNVLDFKVNQGFKDSLFTVRQLQWNK